jgi:hypothetical protein
LSTKFNFLFHYIFLWFSPPSNFHSRGISYLFHCYSGTLPPFFFIDLHFDLPSVYLLYSVKQSFLR